jgi:hypothetical protein
MKRLQARTLAARPLRAPRESNSSGLFLPACLFAAPVREEEPLAESGGRQHQHIGHDEHPIAQRPAVDDEAARRSHDLPREEPPQEALGAPITLATGSRRMSSQ